MKLDSYWLDSAPPLALPAHDLPERVDVAIVGGGFTGLSAAHALARRGARVAVLEAGATVAPEASGRNGGHVNNGLAVDYADVAARVGVAQARAWYHAYDAAVDTVERLVREEAIDCDFLRHGKLKLATRPQHLDALRRSAERLVADGVDTDVEVWGAARVADEVQSDRFVGGLLYKRSGQMHMGRFAQGLAAAAARHGAQIHLATRVDRIERLQGQAHRVHTARGPVDAKQVLLATGASRHGGYGTFGWLRRRIVPIGSFIVVTEPLGAERAQALLAGRRTYVTIANIHHYFRLTADHRLVFGGRAKFAISSPQQDAASGEILRAGLAQTFPQLGQVRIDHCWGGLVDMTQDRLPHAGERDGLFYALGYSGHGTQMSVHMGQCMADVMAGNAAANPWRGREWPAIPGHFGPPWFLPAVGLYYRLKDRLG
ncbi:NAD(P)/FAD-dependent oxidoreductase [Paracidovorax anthurii]|uniref:Glycine/D-amino acid oxidase-like deaminating enzyme n=1 Tax=Paracidovorax anthurii TaxID=78229 RepID=A0A328Z1R6_9BURK|nr:FAD-binding oxidoreductase [Paracidovorax anthurii]RAR79684.1 glycine/D-amino acid oxidase-like deaminating enzyme [Paracidovorax anthurii]